MIWLKLGIVAAVIAAAVTYHEIDRARAYGEGATEERLKWQEQRDKDIAVAEAERRVKQNQIDSIKTALDQERAVGRAEALQAIADAEQKATEDAKSANPACNPVVVSKRVRDSLQNIGHKTAPGAHF